MDEIPDDVMKAARAAIVPGERLQFTTDGLARIAARAILAERERCAMAACDPEKTYSTHLSLEYLNGYVKGRSDAADDIRRGAH